MPQMKPLRDLAKVVRSKNAGPYRLTIDVMFATTEAYEAVRDTGAINEDAVAAAYGIPVSSVSSLYAVDMANAYKITLVRPIAQCDPGESDVYGCQQHVPILNLAIPAA